MVQVLCGPLAIDIVEARVFAGPIQEMADLGLAQRGWCPPCRRPLRPCFIMVFDEDLASFRATLRKRSVTASPWSFAM
jgi:hypothetical protein